MCGLWREEDIVCANMIEENNVNEKNPKKIEIVKGNPKDLNISNVKDSLIMEKPEENEKQNIVIPENINSQDSNEDSSDNH